MNTPPLLYILDGARERRTMYFQSMAELESWLEGYDRALRHYGIDEGVPSLRLPFLFWLWHTKALSTNRGLAAAIGMLTADENEQFDLFFAYLDEYRELRPTVVARVRLTGEHSFAVAKLTNNHSDLVAEAGTPTAISVVRYAPASLHLLRFHFGERFFDRPFVYGASMTYDSTLADALAEVGRDYEVPLEDWDQVAPHGNER